MTLFRDVRAWPIVVGYLVDTVGSVAVGFAYWLTRALLYGSGTSGEPIPAMPVDSAIAMAGIFPAAVAGGSLAVWNGPHRE